MPCEPPMPASSITAMFRMFDRVVENTTAGLLGIIVLYATLASGLTKLLMFILDAALVSMSLARGALDSAPTLITQRRSGQQQRQSRHFSSDQFSSEANVTSEHVPSPLMIRLIAFGAPRRSLS